MTTEQTVIIIDDEPLVRDELRDLLSDHGEIKIIGEAGNIREARDLLKKASPDLVFLDIQLRGGLGFDLVPFISPESHIIFFTAHDEYAVRAFEVNALDYLLKPVDEDRLALALARMGSDRGRISDAPLQPGHLKGDDQVYVKTEFGQCFITVTEIGAVTSIGGNYTSLQLDSQRSYTVRRTLKQWEEFLPVDLFIRIHRSILINKNRIEQLHTDKKRNFHLSLIRIEEPFEVSRRSVQLVKDLLEKP